MKVQGDDYYYQHRDAEYFNQLWLDKDLADFREEARHRHLRKMRRQRQLLGEAGATGTRPERDPDEGDPME